MNQFTPHIRLFHALLAAIITLPGWPADGAISELTDCSTSEQLSGFLGGRSLDTIDAIGGDCGRTPIFNWKKALDPNKYGFCRPRSSKQNQSRSSARFMSAGYNIRRGEFPSFVTIEVMSPRISTICGATLLHKNLVLTAAHCVDSSFTKIKLKFGVISSDGADNLIRYSTKVCRMSPADPKKFGKDVALISLDEPVEYSDDVQPACLRLDEQPNKAAHCFAVGRGKRYNADESRNVYKVLALKMKRDCRQHFPLPFPIRPGFDCWSALERNQGNPCAGDSGGPMYCFGACDGALRQYVVGGTSYGPADSCIPGRTSFDAYADYHLLRRDFRRMVENCRA